MIVIDASVIGPLLLADEHPLADELAGRLSFESLIAPTHWPLEVANLLLVAERRGRLTADRRLIALDEIQGWAVRLDAETAAAAWRETSLLAARHNLTIYDAAYLELARRRNAAVATRDHALIRAARTSGIQILTDLP